MLRARVTDSWFSFRVNRVWPRNSVRVVGVMDFSMTDVSWICRQTKSSTDVDLRHVVERVIRLEAPVLNPVANNTLVHGVVRVLPFPWLQYEIADDAMACLFRHGLEVTIAGTHCPGVISSTM